MTSLNVLRNFTSIALTAFCALGVANARPQTYTLTDLGILPDQKDTASTGAAISGQAQSGRAQIAGTSGGHAFRYTGAGKTPMEDVGRIPFDSMSRGFGINGSGQVVGDSTFGQKKTSHAAIFNNGSATDLGTLQAAGSFSRANGINASGQVVGSCDKQRDGNNSRAFIVGMSSSGDSEDLPRMIDIGTLSGAYAQALGINDSGFVTGNSEIISTGTSGSTHAFIWHPTTGMVDLGTLDGDFSYGTSINAKNHVVGYSTINNVDGRIHAFLHDGKEMRDLGTLSGASVDGDFSFALSVNGADQVVGHTYLPLEQAPGGYTPMGPWPVAFIYSEGLMVNLNDLIGKAGENYRLDSATAINDNGQIVAIAFVTSANTFHAVLLTPLPIKESASLNRVGLAKQ